MNAKTSKRKDRSVAELMPNGPYDIYEKYADLSMRDQVIVIIALLDVALGELLVKRLRMSDALVVESLVGLERDSAPLKNLVARARMCRVLTVIDEHVLNAILELAKLRNIFAHRVEADILSPEINPILQRACQYLKVHALGFYKARPEDGVSLIEYGKKYDDMAARATSNLQEAEVLFRLTAMLVHTFIYYYKKDCDPVFFAMLTDDPRNANLENGKRVRYITWTEAPSAPPAIGGA